MTEPESKSGGVPIWSQLADETKKMIKVVIITAAAMGTIGGGIKAVPSIEPYAPAHRAYVSDKIEEKMHPYVVAQADTAAGLDRVLKFQLQESQRKVRSESAFTTSPALQDLDKQLQEQINDADARIRSRGVPIR